MLLLSFLYFVFWLPAGILSRLFADWLHQRRPSSTAWRVRAARLNRPDHLKEPY